MFFFTISYSCRTPNLFKYRNRLSKKENILYNSHILIISRKYIFEKIKNITVMVYIL